MNTHHHYNPDWLSDDALIANFVARQSDFTFLRGELARVPLAGSAQHYLLVGVRGAGKTTLLKRLAVAIRREPELNDHLIALSFPEELYQVKNLADFWWAACEALVDELDRMKLDNAANDLSDKIEQRKQKANKDKLSSDAGFQLLQQTCAQLQRRPVLLVDNLDMVFDRIDTAGRKLKDPHSATYWELREALSTSTSPLVIGGSVRISAPFKDYDKAFYDFFVPKRLGKLGLDEVREVLERMADAQGMPDVKLRLRARPGRIETLFELTGGNPRALGLIFDLLRNGPTSRAVEDFERLMDITTPYYKARIEDLSEQAQVIMHALAIHQSDTDLQFGPIASEIGNHTGLPTTTVSAQLGILENEGLVEKSAAHGRTQYRIAEQLFRLWLQMRSNRRIRQNVIALTRFFEAMYDAEELQAILRAHEEANPLAEAKFAFALAAMRDVAAARRNDLEAFGVARLRLHVANDGGKMSDYIADTDPALRHLPTEDERNAQDEWVLWLNKGHSAIQNNEFVVAETAFHKAIEIAPMKTTPLIHLGALLADNLNRYNEAYVLLERAIAIDPHDVLPWLIMGNAMSAGQGRHDDAEHVFRKGIEANPADARPCTMLAMLLEDKFGRYAEAAEFYQKSLELDPTDAQTWALFGDMLSQKTTRYNEAKQALLNAVDMNPDITWAWSALTKLLSDQLGAPEEAEATLETATKLNPGNAWIWMVYGNLLLEESRYPEAEVALRKALDLAPNDAGAWTILGSILTTMEIDDRAEEALRQALFIEPASWQALTTLGILLARDANRWTEAEDCLRRAVDSAPTQPLAWNTLGSLLANMPKRHEEAESAFRKVIQLSPENAHAWNDLGTLLADDPQRHAEAEMAYRKATAIDPNFADPWKNLGILLEGSNLDQALAAYERGLELEDTDDPYVRSRLRELKAQIAIADSQKAIDANDLQALRSSLATLLENPEDIATILVSERFVEGLLAQSLANHESAATLLATMRALGYKKYSRPLLLAFEAIIENRADMLSELEPEIQGAAKKMLKRLQAN
ncbi:tetratricopeptide repeat protein [Rugamonas sp. FT82W]|uniref:Tetratricopeptide repeat protein n=1 Tax=Duganella vulcania TaxID=2692166 RepID=A0A845G5A1_9BURK|nr:tetratricopeptide repeat protein [Duganella vulcania]MYM88069.1 tetratricopeptide repeat protein [Duganella vulcania]